jgi:peroxiredoxin
MLARARWGLPAAALAALLAACGAEDAAKAAGPYGTWRAVFPLEGGDLPFGLEIGREDDRDVAWLVNGPERARVDSVTIDGDRVSMKMPGYPHRLEARLVDGRLEGEVTFQRPRNETRTARLVAQRGQAWRFFPAPATQSSDFSGRWALTFTKPDTGAERFAIAELAQRGHEVTGTVLRDSGDDRYIAGEARGDTVFLSRFDGGSAYLYRARLLDDGTLEGEFRTATGGYETVRGRRDAAAELPDAAERTRLKAGGERLQFTFPDLDGRPVSLADPRFAGNVVIVTIGGSWCPNCHDEAAFLREFLQGRRGRGLEVVQLMFEYTADFDEAASLARDFVRKFSIDYPVLIAGTAGEVPDKLPQLETFYAYPTMLVLDREGVVRHVHTGFSGPATGAHYGKFVAEFTALIDGMLAPAG